MTTLSIHDHSRDVAGYTYVYPVVSRRAGGVSIGVNLNPNNACNWACIYCQVPDLTRGNAPPIDLAQLEAELRAFLADLTRGDWLKKHAPAEARTLRDLAFSGNGEPTSAREFAATVELAGRLLAEFGLERLKVRLITNGSLMHRAQVRAGIDRLAALGGEVWFKLDRATRAGMAEVNLIEADPAGVKRRLLACAARCPTWVQTCWFRRDGAAPAETEVAAYLGLLAEVRTHIAGVHLYGIARTPMQPGADRLAPLAAAELEAYGERIRQLGIAVTVNP